MDLLTKIVLIFIGNFSQSPESALSLLSLCSVYFFQKQQIQVDEFHCCVILIVKLLASPFGSSPVDIS